MAVCLHCLLLASPEQDLEDVLSRELAVGGPGDEGGHCRCADRGGVEQAGGTSEDDAVVDHGGEVKHARTPTELVWAVVLSVVLPRPGYIKRQSGMVPECARR